MSGQTVEAGPAGEAGTTNSGHDRGASAGQRQQVRTGLYPRRARPDASLPDRGTSPTVLLRVRELSGCLKNDAAPDLNGMVGETFVEPTQQGDIESGGDPMRPFLIHEYFEQLSVEVVHRIVVATNLRGPAGIPR
jgi:hypothetical protein